MHLHVQLLQVFSHFTDDFVFLLFSIIVLIVVFVTLLFFVAFLDRFYFVSAQVSRSSRRFVVTVLTNLNQKFNKLSHSNLCQIPSTCILCSKLQGNRPCKPYVIKDVAKYS